jgi:glucokinase
MLTLGTGVGGAVVADGKLMRGGFGIGGELGHVTVVDGGIKCGCGRLGCVEQYSSGTALLRELRQIAAEGTSAGARLRELAGDAELTGHHAYLAFQERDPATIEQVEIAAEYLARAMGSLVAVLDPEVFVIGGGLSDLGEGILEPITRHFSAQLPASGFRPEADIVLATFANEAGVIGAADLSRQGGQ